MRLSLRLFSFLHSSEEFIIGSRRPVFYYRPNRLVFPLSSEGFYYLISLLLLPHRVYGLLSLLDFWIFYLVMIYLRDVYFLATFLLVTRFLIAMLFYPVFSIPQSFYLSI